MTRRSSSLGLALVTMTLWAHSARAQTVAAGPYYATPSWDQKLQCDTQATCPRFVVLANWNNEAVLDRETGLVWMRSPIGPTFGDLAQEFCFNSAAGGRLGWRVPSISELTSLLDASTFDLPAGHPFVGIPDSLWSGTHDSFHTQLVFLLILREPSDVIAIGPLELRGLLCVRGTQPN